MRRTLDWTLEKSQWPNGKPLEKIVSSHATRIAFHQKQEYSNKDFRTTLEFCAMDKFQNIKTENKKKRKTGNRRNMSAVCLASLEVKRAQKTSFFFLFFEGHRDYCYVVENWYNIFCRTSCNKVWIRDEHRSASPPAGSQKNLKSPSFVVTIKVNGMKYPLLSVLTLFCV